MGKLSQGPAHHQLPRNSPSRGSPIPTLPTPGPHWAQRHAVGHLGGGTGGPCWREEWAAGRPAGGQGGREGLPGGTVIPVSSSAALPGASCPGKPVPRAGARPTIGSECSVSACSVSRQNSMGRGMEARDRRQSPASNRTRLGDSENLRNPREHCAQQSGTHSLLTPALLEYSVLEGPVSLASLSSGPGQGLPAPIHSAKFPEGLSVPHHREECPWP